MRVGRPMIRGWKGVGTHLVYHVNNGLSVTLSVADNRAGHDREPRLDCVPEDGRVHGYFVSDADRIGRALVVC